MPHTVTLGPAIRAIRKAQGVSQINLAERSRVSGTHLTQIELGSKQPSLEAALRIAHALRVPPEAITYEVVCTCLCNCTRIHGERVAP